ncbi:MAG: hypothetical protein K1060chlam4_00716 [Candidatus Anoxychlamydiales bacterium]|nr:hypothetical protein [Candidatus Anoxychlamydiales bacterium]
MFLASFSSTCRIRPTCPIPAHIQYLSTVPYKAALIIGVAPLATNYLMGWKITALKLAAIGFASVFFLPAIASAKELINYPASKKGNTLTLQDQQAFLQESLLFGGILGCMAGGITFGIASVLSV